MSSFSEIVGERTSSAQMKEDKFNNRLASQIQSYWAVRGYSVDVHVEHGRFSGAFGCRPAFVRSNMSDGHPL